MNKFSTVLAWITIATTAQVNAQDISKKTLPNGVVITISSTNDSIWENLQKTDSVERTAFREFPSVDSLLALGEEFERRDAALIENTESLAPDPSVVERLKAQEIVIEELTRTKHISDTVLRDDILSKINADYPDYGKYSTYEQNQIMIDYVEKFPGVPNKTYYPLPPQSEGKTEK